MKEKIFIILRRSVYFSLYWLDKILDRRNEHFVLCYHSISTDDWYYSVRLEELKKQIKYLKEEGYKFVSLEDIYQHVLGKRKLDSPSVAITIDDGYSDILQAINFFNENKVKPALFLVSDREEVNRKEMGSRKRLLTDLEIKVIQKHGWEIGAHSATHTNLARMENGQLSDEIMESKKELGNLLNSEIKYFAFPFGAYNKEALKLVKNSDYKMALTMDDGMLRKGIDLFKIPRIGVNNTHSISEFKTIYSPSVILFRSFVKSILYKI